MIGLLAAGVAIGAARASRYAGVAICALAATIKVPALVGAVFITVAWARAEPDRGARMRFVAACAAIIVVVLAVVTLATGVGLGWLSTTLFSTPAKVRLAITPATAVGYTVAKLLGLVSIHVDSRSLESAFVVIATVISAAIGVWLLLGARVARLLAPLGAVPAGRRRGRTGGVAVVLHLGARAGRGLAGAAALDRGGAGAGRLGFLVKPVGILALPLQSAPAVLAVYVAIAVWAWRRYGPRRRRQAEPRRPSLVRYVRGRPTHGDL